MTLQQIRGHSLAQLRLLAAAKERLAAKEKLVVSRVVFTAVAACWAKEGSEMLKEFRDELFEQAFPESVKDGDRAKTQPNKKVKNP